MDDIYELQDMNELTQDRVKSVDLKNYPIQPEALWLIPESMARKYCLVPVAITDNVLQVAMSELDDVSIFQEIAVISKMRINPLLANKEAIQNAIDYNYKSYVEIENQFGNDSSSPSIQKEKLTITDLSDAPVVRALDLIISEAVKVRTSDIHIEPHEDKLRVRYRIDGVIHDTMTLPMSAHSSLISRIKVMANMNIADSRPQDGQFSTKVKNRDIDIRVATVDTIYGQMCTLRILDKSFLALNLPQLGLLPDRLAEYKRMLKSPFGMILICGPTGSGKTTTLYASINSLDSKSKKIVTIEDPIEYRLNEINQIQVNDKAGLTFAAGLRSMMRHDPNIIMIGEIRDSDTVKIATQAALTGQLVLSSIHANDTIGSLFRLQDMGIGHFLIAATVIGVVSQRLVRRICPHCSRLVEAPPEAQLLYSKETGEEKSEFLYGEGCNFCANTGYLGRVPLLEVLVMNKDIRSALLSSANADELREIARRLGAKSMWNDGMLKVKEGVTTPSEVLSNLLEEG